MDPKLHALIPLASGVALAFTTACSKDEGDPFLAFCEKAAECSSEAVTQPEIQQCADYLEFLWAEGEPRQWAADCLSGFTTFYRAF